MKLLIIYSIILIGCSTNKHLICVSEVKTVCKPLPICPKNIDGYCWVKESK